MKLTICLFIYAAHYFQQLGTCTILKFYGHFQIFWRKLLSLWSLNIEGKVVARKKVWKVDVWVRKRCEGSRNGAWRKIWHFKRVVGYKKSDVCCLIIWKCVKWGRAVSKQWRITSYYSVLKFLIPAILTSLLFEYMCLSGDHILTWIVRIVKVCDACC